MTSKTYSKRSNCIRAARSALGKTAKPGVDFTINGSGKEFTWKAAGAKRKRVKGEAKLQDQPQMVKLIKACHRQDGVTVVELAALLGGVEQHTVRGSISRLKAEGVKIDAVRVGGRKHFHIERPASA